MHRSRILRNAAVLLLLLAALGVPSASVIAEAEAASVDTSTTSSNLMRYVGWMLLGLLGGSALATYAKAKGGAPAVLGIVLAVAFRTLDAWGSGRSIGPPLACLGVMLLVLPAVIRSFVKRGPARSRRPPVRAQAPGVTMVKSVVVAIIVFSVAIWTNWTVWGLLPDPDEWAGETKLFLTAAVWAGVPVARWLDTMVYRRA